MTDRNAPPAARRLGLAVLTAGLLFGGVAASCHKAGLNTAGETAAPPDGKATPPAAPDDWPADAKPEAVIVLSGETFGYLQPCGCSRPQKGGLERRANLIAGLKAKGWPVVAADLGDLYPHDDPDHPLGPPRLRLPAEQARLRYVTSLHALRDMGYVAAGVGKTEFDGGLVRLVAEYPLQKEQPPYLLAGNLSGLADGKSVPREQFFPPAEGGARPTVGLAEVTTAGPVTVGVVGVVGDDVAAVGRKADKALGFADARAVLQRAVAGLPDPAKKPAVNVLLFQDSAENAAAVAKDRPEFQVVLCRSEDPEPPQFPKVVTHPDGRKTLVIQVGHKGRYVGLVGAFKRPGGGLDLKYRLVPLGEDYLTPPGEEAAKANPALARIEEYAREVKDRDFLRKVLQAPHPSQLQQPKLNLSFVGADRCAGCHPGEYAKWKTTPHSHAYESLEKAARPGLRPFDPECAVCHTVGYGFKTGFAAADKTPGLLHNGCENCHGPGSGHMGSPRNADLLALQAPWKAGNPANRLPDRATMEKIAALDPTERGKVPLTTAQELTVRAVAAMCMRCHDGDNDPHFDLFKYWPKVAHSGLAGK
ncbi:MAG: hypothetical protein K2X87_34790 [Gemmataceae bacterium]|nr:hypothetical protein [Gemmataceae bacterium]